MNNNLNTNKIGYIYNLILYTIIYASWALQANAQEVFKSNSPIEILSDEAKYYNSDSKAIFKGNVIATQDTMTIKTEVMEVEFDKKSDNNTQHGLSKAILTGGVEIVNNKDTAKSNTGEYDSKTGFLTLRGNVMLKQNGNTIYGDELIYSSHTGESVIKKDPKSSNSRVRAHIVPDQEKNK